MKKIKQFPLWTQLNQATQDMYYELQFFGFERWRSLKRDLKIALTSELPSNESYYENQHQKIMDALKKPQQNGLCQSKKTSLADSSRRI